MEPVTKAKLEDNGITSPLELLGVHLVQPPEFKYYCINAGVAPRHANTIYTCPQGVEGASIVTYNITHSDNHTLNQS